MLRIREAVLVEGSHDIARLRNAVDTLTVQSRGFRIFKDKQLVTLLDKLARGRGLIVLTDSDGAGFVIRNYISGIIPPEFIKHAYIPQIAGKEPRKHSSSAQGLLGVEGVDTDTIVNALLKSGATVEHGKPHVKGESITAADLLKLNLTGGTDSAARRNMLMKFLGFPENITCKRMLGILNAFMAKSDLEELVKELFGQQTACINQHNQGNNIV